MIDETAEDSKAAPASARASLPANPTPLMLVVIGPAGAGNVQVPVQGHLVLGRAPECDVHIEDPKLSRRHAELRCGATIAYVDLGSRNGSLVRGSPAPPNVPVPLRVGDAVTIGSTMLTLQRGPSARAARVAVNHEAVTTQGAIAVEGAIDRMEPLIQRVAAATINVLIFGETGVGKDVLARRIHARSPRAKLPLLSINCGALAENLLESELFGYEKGAFTGALQAKPGLLESANAGTVFLDEVGEMPQTTQVKLLRVLDQREVMRVGAVRPRVIDVRFIAATNRNLETEVAEGRFRQDLYFRLNGISLSLPPLRERVDEIEPLARMFLAQVSSAMGRGEPPRIAPEAVEALLQYPWPGNIRELRNVIERAVVLCTDDVITPAHVPLETMGAARAREGAIGAMPASGAPDSDAERRRIVEALEACAGNQSHAAKRLGISRATLIRRIEDHAIRRPRKGQ